MCTVRLVLTLLITAMLGAQLSAAPLLKIKKGQKFSHDKLNMNVIGMKLLGGHVDGGAAVIAQGDRRPEGRALPWALLHVKGKKITVISKWNDSTPDDDGVVWEIDRPGLTKLNQGVLVNAAGQMLFHVGVNDAKYSEIFLFWNGKQLVPGPQIEKNMYGRNIALLDDGRVLYCTDRSVYLHLPGEDQKVVLSKGNVAVPNSALFTGVYSDGTNCVALLDDAVVVIDLSGQGHHKRLPVDSNRLCSACDGVFAFADQHNELTLVNASVGRAEVILSKERLPELGLTPRAILGVLVAARGEVFINALATTREDPDVEKRALLKWANGKTTLLGDLGATLGRRELGFSTSDGSVICYRQIPRESSFEHEFVRISDTQLTTIFTTKNTTGLKKPISFFEPLNLPYLVACDNEQLAVFELVHLTRPSGKRTAQAQ